VAVKLSDWLIALETMLYVVAGAFTTNLVAVAVCILQVVSNVMLLSSKASPSGVALDVGLSVAGAVAEPVLIPLAVLSIVDTLIYHKVKRS